MIIEQVAFEVKEWSLSNFGDQRGINHIAPALGLVEEVGELQAAIQAEDQALIEDSIGDIGIYTLDLIARLDIPVRDVWPQEMGMRVDRTIAVGRIAHCVLKRHQGIRGFKDENYFRKEVTLAIADLLGTLERNWDITTLTVKTWESVKERNWKKNAVTGEQ